MGAVRRPAAGEPELLSMTGYGEAEAAIGPFLASVSLRAVNSRYLDLRFKAPSVLAFLEPEARKLVQTHIWRGKVEVGIQLQLQTAAAGSAVQVNIPLARGYLEAFRQLQRELGLAAAEVPLALLVSQREVLQSGPEPEMVREDADSYLALVERAVLALRSMQVVEGQALKADLLARVEHLESLLAEISAQAAALPAAVRERLAARMQVLLAGRAGLDDDRLYQEAALQAEKADITEELVRFRSHCQQFRQTVTGQGGARGKKLDFIIQELLRETNTIGSKASCLPVAQTVILLKNELEKLREQVQNIA